MITKRFPLKEIQAVANGDSQLLTLVETFEWKHEFDSDSESSEIIFYETIDPGVFWSVGITRSGSPWSDWHYEWGEEWDTKLVEAMRVEKVEKIITVWETVKGGIITPDEKPIIYQFD